MATALIPHPEETAQQSSRRAEAPESIAHPSRRTLTRPPQDEVKIIAASIPHPSAASMASTNAS